MTRASDTARLLGAGATINDGTTITTADNTAQLELVSTDADSGIGPHQVFYRNSSSPADADLLCELDFRGRNDNSQDVDYATINVKATDVSDGTEDGQFILQTKQSGSTVDRMNLSSSQTVFNEDSKDIDFRVESDGYAHTLFVQGGSGKVGIGDSSPNSYNNYASNLVINNGGDSNGHVGMTIACANDKIGSIYFADSTSGSAAYAGALYYVHSTNNMKFLTNSTERMSIDSSGKLLLNTTSVTTGRINSVADLSAMHTCTFRNSDNNTGGIFLRQQNHAGQDCGNITQTGSTTVSYGTSSDYRLKENVSYDFDATTRLKQLKPCRFNFIADGTDKVVDGFLAHEAQTVVPESVVGEKNAVDDDNNPILQQIDQSKLVPLLVKTIQELEARITALESA